MVGMRLYTVRVRIVTVNTGVGGERGGGGMCWPVTTGSCVTGRLGGAPHVLSILGCGKVKSWTDVAQLLRATT